LTSPEPPGDPKLAQGLLDEIRTLAGRIGRIVRLMEVCGTHTMSIYRAGLPALLPENVRLLSGPGCPVCVTPMGYVDAAIALAGRPEVTVTTFGDMMRVPGSETSLEQAHAGGADVRVVYSPLDALRLAEEEANRQVIFLGVGFETTAPTAAVTLAEARRRGVGNFFMLSAHKLVPPALRALLADENVALDGLILPGHVSAVLGTEPYEFIAREFGKGGVVTGFETTDVIQGILMLLQSIAAGRARIENQYTRVVKREGNQSALKRIRQCLEPRDTEWRGLGLLPQSGLRIRAEFSAHDAEFALGVAVAAGREPAGCRCGEVLRGIAEPEECMLFAKRCTPLSPVGPCMVSSEGTCAAHFKYRRE